MYRFLRATKEKAIPNRRGGALILQDSPWFYAHINIAQRVIISPVTFPSPRELEAALRGLVYAAITVTPPEEGILSLQCLITAPYGPAYTKAQSLRSPHTTFDDCPEGLLIGLSREVGYIHYDADYIASAILFPCEVSYATIPHRTRF